MTDSTSSQADDQKARTAAVFNRAASTYDQVGPRFFAHYGLRLVELAQIPQGSVVLDVASGRGASLFPAVDRIGPSGRAVGIDLRRMVDDPLLARHARVFGETPDN